MHFRIANTVPCSVLCSVLCSSLLLLAAPALPAGAPAEPAPAPVVDADVEDITITGQRPQTLRRIMMDFVTEIGDPTPGQRGYARWRDEVCVGIHNLSDRVAAQYLADRISAVALELELEPGEPGCRPDINVVFAQDGSAMATQMVDAMPGAFNPFRGAGGTIQGLTALERFKNSDAPVRWWQITMEVDELGNATIDIFGNGPVMIRGSNSRIRNSVKTEIWGTLLVVDGNKLAGKNWPQLADYLAMVALAQIDPDGVPASHDSILNLFGTANPQTLSEMDLAYLHALYSIDTMIVPQAQRGMLARSMVQSRREAE